MDELEKVLKALALIQASLPVVLEFIQNHQAQKGKTTQEILDHAEKTNAEAKEIINNL